MLRTASAATIGLLGALIVLSPAAAVATEAGTTTTGMSTTTAASTTTSTSAAPTTPSVRPTSTTPPPTRRVAVAPRPSQSAASLRATVTISTNCTYFCFAPANTTVIAGGTVSWVDKSRTRHNITRCDPANCNGVNRGTGTDASFTAAHLSIPAGGTAHFTFAQPGTYVYYCAIHGYALMHGTITVVAAEVTTVPPVAAPVVAAPATTAAGPRLASTGSGSGRALAAALVLLVLGLTATTFRLGRRFS